MKNSGRGVDGDEAGPMNTFRQQQEATDPMKNASKAALFGCGLLVALLSGCVTLPNTDMKPERPLRRPPHRNDRDAPAEPSRRAFRIRQRLKKKRRREVLRAAGRFSCRPAACESDWLTRRCRP
ncbi:hypothetical protein BLAT2472_40467 [Burkholderia latens]